MKIKRLFGNILNKFVNELYLISVLISLYTCMIMILAY